jgi:hypothetical protein
VTLDGFGNGVTSLGPNVGEEWRLDIAAIRTSTFADPTVPVPSCEIFMGASLDPQFLVDGTFSGNLNSTDAVSSFPLTAGQKCWAKWSNGDPGSTAVLSITGVANTGRR